ncbi:MAG: methyltransferase domain-containing protein, partial [Phycisphaeraceae bacterium]
RELVGELMDDPALPEQEHALALKGLRRINAISRTAAVLLHQLVRLMGDDPSQPRRILDVACGDGDTTMMLVKLASKHGLPWQVSGCDISERAVSFARKRAIDLKVDSPFYQADALRDLDVQGYDAVVNSLFLHHLEDQQIVAFLRRLQDAQHVVISDLVRSRRAYATTWLGVRLLSRSQVVHVDGPLSVRAALTKNEMCELAGQGGLTGATIQSSWPMRQLLVWSRPS